MAQFNYQRSQTTAKRLISRFGQDVTLKVQTPGGGTDPWNPDAPSEAMYTRKGAVLGFKKHEIDGTLILATDKKVYMAVGDDGPAPSPEHTLSIGGVDHSIVNAMPLSPAGTNVYFELQVRK